MVNRSGQSVLMKVSTATDIVEIKYVHSQKNVSSFEWPKPKGTKDVVYQESFWVGNCIIRPSITPRGDLFFQKAIVPAEGGTESKELSEFVFARTDATYAINYPLVCVFEPNLKYAVTNLLRKGDDACKTFRLVGIQFICFLEGDMAYGETRILVLGFDMQNNKPCIVAIRYTDTYQVERADSLDDRWSIQKFALLSDSYRQLVLMRSEIRRAFLINGSQDMYLRDPENPPPILFSTVD